MKKLIALLLAALLMMSFACAEEITAVETTIPLSQPDSPVTITLTYTGTLDIEFSPYAPPIRFAPRFTATITPTWSSALRPPTCTRACPCRI